MTPTQNPPERAVRGLREHEGAILGGLLLLVALFLLPDLGPGALPGSTVTLEHARIVAIGSVDQAPGLETATVVIIDGPNGGQTLDANIDPTAPGVTSPPYAVGEEVVVQVSTTPEGTLAAISDRWRVPLLAALLGAFALVVVLVGGWRGVRALIALVLTIGVVVKIVLPLLIGGWSPVPLAIVTASGVTITTLLLTEGLRRRTVAAALGTLGALALTAVLAALANALAAFGLLQSSEDAAYLRSILGTNLDLGGLLLAAIIFGALGVLDDVTITQAATVGELAEADPRAPRSILVARAMNVGRAHIAATINTLVLAYVSASLPLLLLFAVGGQAGSAIASTEIVAIEIVRTLVGSIGIVAAVPLTTLIAAALVPSEGRASRTG
jgi:uncharacterized membrane protein